MDDRVSRGTRAEGAALSRFPGKYRKQSDLFLRANRGAIERGPANGAALLVPTDYNRLAEFVTDSAPATRAMDCHSWIRSRSPPSWPAFLLLLWPASYRRRASLFSSPSSTHERLRRRLFPRGKERGWVSFKWLKHDIFIKRIIILSMQSADGDFDAVTHYTI